MQKSLFGFQLGRPKGRKSSQLTPPLPDKDLVDGYSSSVHPLDTTGGSRVPNEVIQIQPSNEVLELFDLPNEIFCLIFLHARNLSLIPSLRSLTTRPIEITISHVCKFWRSISINYPPLWDTFRYVLPKSPLVKAKDRFASYIERSGSHPLYIWFNFRGDDRKVRYDDHVEMLTILLSQVDRWRRITILQDSSLPWRNLRQDLKELHPVYLEHFAIWSERTIHSTDTRGFFHPNIFRSGAPKLKSVRLTTTIYGVFLPPLTNLTTFRFETPSYFSKDMPINLSTIMALLAIPSLENLSVSGIQFLEPIRDRDLENITMKRLQDFRCGSEDLAYLLQYIRAPCLHTLTLRDVGFPNLNTQSAPELTNLIILNCRVPWLAFSDELLFIASRITQLTVSETSDGTFHLHALTTFGTDYCWPQLASLNCNIQTVSRVDLYLELALSRIDRPFTVRVHQNLLDMWYQRTPDLLPHVDGVCMIKGWDSDTNPLVPLHWPYAEDRAEHPFDKADYDPFRVTSYH